MAAQLGGKHGLKVEPGASALTTTSLNMSTSDASDAASVCRLQLPTSPWRQAAVDIISGALSWQSWGTLGWHDIRQRYRRSKLGPFWITITMGVTIGSIGLIFSALMGQKIDEFLPFFAAGNIIWTLLSTIITEGCTTFIGSEGIIRQIKMPYSIHIFRMLWRNLIVFAHNIWVFVAAVVIYAVWPNSSIWLAVPGLIVVVVNGVWIALILGLFCARFRDIPLIIASALQLLYLATPIIWLPNSLHGRHTFVFEYNPLYHLLELVRAPLLGHAPALVNWEVGIAIALLGWAFTFVMFARYRWRIPYWV